MSEVIGREPRPPTSNASSCPLLASNTKPPRDTSMKRAGHLPHQKRRDRPTRGLGQDFSTETPDNIITVHLASVIAVMALGKRYTTDKDADKGATSRKVSLCGRTPR